MASDFKELIKAQQETTKAMMSAEDAAKYDAILAERKLEFDKKVKRLDKEKKLKDNKLHKTQKQKLIKKPQKLIKRMKTKQKLNQNHRKKQQLR